MRTKNIKAKETDSWALPGNPISLDEFKKGLKKAAEGPFYTVEESKKMLVEWRKKSTGELFWNRTLSFTE